MPRITGTVKLCRTNYRSGFSFKGLDPKRLTNLVNSYYRKVTGKSNVGRFVYDGKPVDAYKKVLNERLRKKICTDIVESGRICLLER